MSADQPQILDSDPCRNRGPSPRFMHGPCFQRRRVRYARNVDSPAPLRAGPATVAGFGADAEHTDDLVRCWGVADDGVIIEVAVHPSVADALAERWPPIGLARCDRPMGPVAHCVTVSHADDSGGLRRSWDRVESGLALFASERLAGLVAVHAAVIVRGSQALVVPGASGVGKSTLCVAAAAAGAQILTDEYALVNPASGLVAGWRRPVRVRRPDGGADRFELATESEPVRVGLVAFVAHAPGCTPSWAPITGADTVLGLLANTVCARSRPDAALDAALAVARSARAVAGSRGEAADAVVELLALLDDTLPPDGG